MNTNQHDYQRIARAIAFIREEFPRRPDLREIADHVHLSEYHFQKMFSRWAGVSPKKFQQYLSLDYARGCLREDFSLEQTAWESGLSGTGRLHDLFVNFEGVTPGEYRSRGDRLEIDYGFHESPFGEILIGATERGICWLDFPSNRKKSLQAMARHWENARISHSPSQTQTYAEQLFTSPQPALDLYVKGTAFQLKVWEALLKIPEGNLVSYGQLASAIGNTRASRAVGTAVGQNTIAWIIPCHRVIRQTGEYGQYRWGSERKSAFIGWEAARTKTIH